MLFFILIIILLFDSINGNYGYGMSSRYKSGNQCGGFPQQSMNGLVKCSKNSCKYECFTGYQFPNGLKTIWAVCKNRQWVVEGYRVIPNCEPICTPPCMNNGICIGPGQCNCPENFGGPQCQNEKKPCLDFPPLPMNSERKCSSTFCTVTCFPRHRFPDGSTMANLSCRNGLWLPSREDWVSLPDCNPICDPPCQNGGVCMSLNTCQCPQDYRGPQCQYLSSECHPTTKLNFNGAYNCSGDVNQFICTLSCPPGSKFTSQPAAVYTCLYSEGCFEPQPIPQCDYGKNTIVSYGGSSKTIYHQGSSLYETSGSESSGDAFVDIVKTGGVYGTGHMYSGREESKSFLGNEGHPGYYGSDAFNNIHVNVYTPVPGTCFTWGGAHYKTFDGVIYSFHSNCRHILVRDSEEHKFSIGVKHRSCRTRSDCSSEISVFLHDKEYTIKKSDDGGIVFRSVKHILPIPSMLPGLSVTMLGSKVLISLTTFSIKVIWDTKQTLQVDVTESLWNRTEGLCGVIDGHPHNDLMTKTNTKPSSITTLAESWQINKIGEQCDDNPSESNECINVPNDVKIKAETFCAKLTSNEKFKQCFKVMDIDKIVKSCEWDYCGCQNDNDPEECACESLGVYASQCVLAGIKELKQWRDQQFCPMKCTSGKVYKACGPETQPSCSFIKATIDNNSTCTEGCFCPDSMYLHDGKCLYKTDCPCRLRNRNFPPGATIPKDCNTCKCEAGEWKCTQLPCGARCSAIGDPHYTTFDGRHYDFMGDCSYHLLTTTNFSIDVENVACPGAISESMNLLSSSQKSQTCTKSVTITYNSEIIKLNQHGLVTVNGNNVKKLPARFGKIIIRPMSSLFLQVLLPNKVAVWWDGMTRAYVDVPASFRDKTKGLCGTFNSNQKDDFSTPEGDIEQSVHAFANKWRTREMCDHTLNTEPDHPCLLNVQNKATAEQMCSKIKSKLFEACHWYVDVERFYADCMYDMCACEVDISKCMCPILGAYAMECANNGVNIDWRYSIKECEIPCSGGQMYQTCANSCVRKCWDVAFETLELNNCNKTCVEGCACPTGQVLNDDGDCIPIGRCPCEHDGLTFDSGYKEVRLSKLGNGKDLCVCLGAKWDCKPATKKEIEKYPRALDIKDKCPTDEHLQFTTCEPVVPTTCKNMHIPVTTSTAECKPGCECMQGYVFESISKQCLKPDDCPCHHGGKSYKAGFEMQEECNTCECKKGNWSCTDYICNGVCTAWGDSHFTTFDGKDYDFQGVCTYLLAMGAIEKEKFSVEIQNEACGTTGATCSKSGVLKYKYGDKEEVLLFAKGTPIPDQSSFKRIQIHTAGMFVFFNIPAIKLSLQWDKGTRLYLRLNPKWKNKVSGLCGNYNGDIRDDFQTPSGGLAEASPLLFADSWRLQAFCPQAIEVHDYCTERPNRAPWADQECSGLKKEPFIACHSEIPVDPWYERCRRDTCSCDAGGDCGCVCAALAAYAHACAARGVVFQWRCQKQCPMQCSKGTYYHHCISACPIETCDNALDYYDIQRSCKEDGCVEGCKPKLECEPGYVYTNNNFTECVPRSSCKPQCMTLEDGRIVLEGEIIVEDNCHVCRCSRGEKICTGQPCKQPDIAIPLIVPLSTHCTTGWTKWLNKNQPDFYYNKNKTKFTYDKENLPTITDLMNEVDTGACAKEMMTMIECRTVDGKLPANETALNVTCALDNGLYCHEPGYKSCPDFEIRVFCLCEPVVTTKEPQTRKLDRPRPKDTIDSVCDDVIHPNKKHPTDCHKFYQCAVGMGPPEHPDVVLKTCGGDMMYNPITMTCDWDYTVKEIRPECNEKVEKCPPDNIWSDCAINCNKLCHYYKATLVKNGICTDEKVCIPGCVPNDLNECQDGYLRRDNTTCVSVHDCTCISNTDVILKPNQIVKEDCALCQCIDNHYVCDNSKCVEIISNPTLTSSSAKYTIHVPTFTTQKPVEILTTTATPIIVTSTSTPPLLCDESRYTYINRDLPESSFSASSVKDTEFAPFNALLDSRPLDISEGCWIPLISNKRQYIQVALERRTPLYGVVLQGSPKYDHYITSYHVLYGDDGQLFSYITNSDGSPKIFRGPINHNDHSKQIFEKPIEAKFVRINPLTWHKMIAIRFELIGCGEMPTTITSVTPTTLPACVDSIGLEVGLPVSNVEVSSIRDDSSLSYLELNQPNAFRPLYNMLGESIMFDFTGLRNITGLTTKGGKTGWVTAYKIVYSQNKESWNKILDATGKEQVFHGNFDQDTPVNNYFSMPLHARYMKLVVSEWQHDIEIRIEPKGCFIPYEVPSTTTILIIESTKPTTECVPCPGLLTTTSECSCKQPNNYYDGESCTSRAQCPCYIGLIPYQVGSVYQSSQCEECRCKLGGIPECKPKSCPKCSKDLIPKLSETCECSCEPCPIGTRICPTSDVCINETSWCDGVQDCSDDELACEKPSSELTTEPTHQLGILENKTVVVEDIVMKNASLACERPKCSPGYKVKIIESSDNDNSILAPIKRKQRKGYAKFFKGYKVKKGGVKGIKSLKSPEGFSLPKPTEAPELKHHQQQAAEQQACARFTCVKEKQLKDLPGFITSQGDNNPDECAVPSCPSNYKLEQERAGNKNDCPIYTCTPTVKPDVICNVTGRTFNTFDNIEYKFDICDHLLARDAAADKWSVIATKNCTKLKGCVRELTIRQNQDSIHMLPSLELQYNGLPYTVEQTNMIGIQQETFSVSKTGDTIFFVSPKYGYWVIFDKNGDARIGLAYRHIGLVDGLCGYFDANPLNDKRRPDGKQASSTEEFGNSWARPNLQADACEEKVCPIDLQREADKLCKVVYEKSLSNCAKVTDLDKWHMRCIERICDCVENSKTTNVTHTPKECLCQALQCFVVDCQSRGVDLEGWRTELNCPASCPPPLVHRDCYRRKCEPTCGEQRRCPQLSGVCFSGCYCPEGMLRKGDTCIPPSECRDCVCEGTGSPSKYVTFEKDDLPFNGNCTYIAARDKTSGEHKFEVFVTNGPCENSNESVCVDAVHIVYSQHVLHIQRNFVKQKMDVTVDGNMIYKYPVKNDWLELVQQSGKDVSLIIPGANLEIATLFKNMAFSIKVPSVIYKNKTEGLCGVCEGIEEQLIMSNGTRTNDVQEFGLSWLAKKPALDKLKIKVEDKCMEKPKNECLPLPPNQDPCFKILDPQKFGMCHLVIDPSPYLASCQQDLCMTGHQVGACASLERYAAQCSQVGVCINWRDTEFCPYPCEGSLEYKPCKLGCAITCDNYDHMTSDPNACQLPNTEGCFCPDGMVLINNTCTEQTKCYPCDDEHYAGDEWQVDDCTVCSCIKSDIDDIAHTSCTKKSCSQTICPSHLQSIKLEPKVGECCPEIVCVEKTTESPHCDEPQRIKCGPSQVLKLDSPANQCPRFICVCKPTDECEPINEQETTELGMELKVDRSGCCPIVTLVCKPETCPQPEDCPPMMIVESSNVTGKCCPIHACSPPKDKCVIDLEWETAPKGGEKKRSQPERLLKEIGSIWLDGPCRSCLCSRGVSGPTASCSVNSCPSIVSTDDFVVEAQFTPYTCCAEPVYIACRHEDKVYKVGEKWTSKYDLCKSYMCIANNEGKLEKRTTIQQCETTCLPGSEYKPAPDKCCGQCIPMACLVDGSVRSVGQVWTSLDGCTNYTCAVDNNTVHIKSSELTCPPISELMRQEYELKEVIEAGQCCNNVEIIACKVGNETYQEGSSWNTIDPCKNITCTRDAKTNKLTRTESIETCSEQCKLGWSYIPTIDNKKCCGDCVQVACVDGEQLRELGSVWYSPDNCTKYECSQPFDQMYISSYQEVCPPINDCPKEKLYTKGCCKLCNVTAMPASQVSSSCSPVALPNNMTLSIVRAKIQDHGVCVNEQPISGLMECKGTCKSGTLFNNETASHDTLCQCCQASTYDSLVVEVKCKDGTKHVHKIPTPKKCECFSCSDKISVKRSERYSNVVKKSGVNEEQVEEDIEQKVDQDNEQQIEQIPMYYA